MESRVISSTVPQLADLPRMTAVELTALRNARIDDPFELARYSPDGLAAESDLDEQSARRLVETARLVTLRGIGTRHARALVELDVLTVCDLARRDSAALYASVSERRPGHRPTPAETRVWIRAAARRCPP